MTASGTRGVLNDALSIYFGDAPLPSATVTIQNRGRQRRLPGAGGIADATSWSDVAPGTMSEGE